MALVAKWNLIDKQHLALCILCILLAVLYFFQSQNYLRTTSMMIYKNFGTFLLKPLAIKHLNVLFKKQNQLCFLSLQEFSTRGDVQDRKSLSVGKNKNNQISEHVKVTERIKQTTKDVTNISVIIAGIGISCIVFYAIFKEFFSSKSPSSVFSCALKKCKEDPRVVELLGEPIKGQGEMTRRGRARHVSFVEYENNGKTYLRIKFYLKGSKSSATVQCETGKDSAKSHFRYLFVEMDYYPHQVIVVEDNRLSEKLEIAA